MERRRCLVGIALGLLALTAPAHSQQTGKVYRVGTLTSAWAPNHPAVEGLRAGLDELGFVEGRVVTFDHRYTEGDLSALPRGASALVAAGVDLIFTTNAEGTRAAKSATATIPIVFSAIGDPVAAGLVETVARPGGNVTGVSSLVTELTPKRMEILKELTPRLARVWAIYDAAGDTGEVVAANRKAEEAARRLKLELIVRALHTPEERAATFEAVRHGDGLLVHDRPTALDIPAQILKLSLSTGVPAVFSSAFWVGYGAFVSYGADYHASGRQAARLVTKILRGTHPRDLPVEGANKIELAINLRTARAAGLTVPRSLLLRADKVIE